MSRPRIHKTGLPKYVRIKSGAYYYHDRKLCRVDDGESAMYDALADRKALHVSLDTIPIAVAAYKHECLPALSPSARKEHGRLLDIFSKDFAEYRVDQITSRDIKGSIKDLFGKDKPTAAKAYKSRISTFFRWCIEEEAIIQVNPCREVWLKKPMRKKSPWTDKLFWDARDKLDPMMQCYHDLSFLLYQRTTDVRLLARSQIRDTIIHFEPTKTEDSSGLEVDIQITPAIQAVLDRAAGISKEWKLICPYVIHTKRGMTYTRSGVYSAYRRADIALHGAGDIIGLNPKSIRPFAATSAKKQGFDIDEIKTGLAHTMQRTTEGYIQHHEVPVSVVNLLLPVKPK